VLKEAVGIHPRRSVTFSAMAWTMKWSCFVGKNPDKLLILIA
jgi:hypothetical protein